MLALHKSATYCNHSSTQSNDSGVWVSLRQTRTIRPVPATEPAAGLGAATRVGPEALDVVVAGAHGGAGTSTLATLLPTAWDMGSIESLLELDCAPLDAKGRPIVLAARNTAAAAKCATAAIGVLHDWDEQVAALAIVSDGGPESRDATARFALLEARVGTGTKRGWPRTAFPKSFRPIGWDTSSRESAASTRTSPTSCVTT
ncbi:hypothetical protein GCM10009727_36890 [Actinomadura napierensis]|uniref:Uncharacterized protein n=2 Tax=Actinomadura napierensis TaxID=267854 RepID=A0ABN2ZCA3_9ACTN